MLEVLRTNITLRSACLHLFNLPGCGNMDFEYYHHWHLKHHAALGTQTHRDGPDALRLVALDGDLFAPSTCLLVLNQWLLDEERRRYWLSIPLALLLDLLTYVVLHIFMLLQSLCTALLLVVAVPRLFFLSFCNDQAAELTRHLKPEKAKYEHVTTQDEWEEYRWRQGLQIGTTWHILHVGAHNGLHTWLNIGTLAVILSVEYSTEQGGWKWSNEVWEADAVMTALLYLVLSEVFMHGGLWHPYRGYFLSVHHGYRDENDPTQPCQPTTSVYGPLASVATGNLNYHVEHHDFPNVPWTRLPQITRLAPGFYEGLHTTSFCAVMADQCHLANTGGYACQ